MLKKKKFPILEFDTDTHPIINAREQITKISGISDYCIICFFQNAIKKFLRNNPDYEVVYIFMGSGGFIKAPVYKVKVGNGYVCLTQAIVGAPVAAAQIDEISALGYTKFLCIGSAGVIDKEHQYGKLMLPTAAIRDEGTSYHYVKPAYEIEVDKKIIKTIEDYFNKNKLPFIKGKTWTTDAFYRETKGKIALRKSQGCISVEMECAAYLASAKYNDVQFGQILYAGDCIGDEMWHNKRWKSKTMREQIQYELLEHAMKIVRKF